MTYVQGCEIACEDCEFREECTVFDLEDWDEEYPQPWEYITGEDEK